MQFKDIIKGFVELECDYINISIIYTPEYLNPAIMMLHYKDETEKEINSAIAYLTQFTSKDRSDCFIAYQGIKNIWEYIHNHKVEEKHWTAFKEYIKKTDGIWKQEFNDYFTNYQFDKNTNRILRNV
jgi:hypothetical protein